MKFPNKIRVWRAERRITQRDLALKTRISLTKIWEIENGYTIPTTAERAAIARVLKASQSDLFPEAVAS